MFFAIVVPVSRSVVLRVGEQVGFWQGVSYYKFKLYFCACRYFSVVLRTIVPGSKTLLEQKLFWFVATTMASSGFGPYHGLWRKDTPTKRIDITTPTSGAMMHALGLGVLAPQPKIYHTYSTAIFCDFFFAHDIKMIVNNNMILD
jgi:hypothetical protein